MRSTRLIKCLQVFDIVSGGSENSRMKCSMSIPVGGTVRSVQDVRIVGYEGRHEKDKDVRGSVSV